MAGQPTITCTVKRFGPPGISLVETMMAIFILLLAVGGILPVFRSSTQTLEQQGNLVTRCTEYAQDKMEQLMKLNFTDGTSDTTQFPTGTCASGCGLGGTMGASVTVGSTTSNTTYFVDYLDASGNLLSNSTGAFYRRRWDVVTDTTANMKTITVIAAALGTYTGTAPSTTLVCMKATGQ